MSKKATVRQFMTPIPITFQPDTEVLDAVAVLVKRGISGAPVVDQKGNLVGVLTERDCLKIALSASYHGERGGKLSRYMTTDVATVDIDMPLIKVVEMFVDASYKRYPVMERNRLVGVISRRDALTALLQLY